MCMVLKFLNQYQWTPEHSLNRSSDEQSFHVQHFASWSQLLFGQLLLVPLTLEKNKGYPKKLSQISLDNHAIYLCFCLTPMLDISCEIHDELNKKDDVSDEDGPIENDAHNWRHSLQKKYFYTLVHIKKMPRQVAEAVASAKGLHRIFSGSRLSIMTEAQTVIYLTSQARDRLEAWTD